VRLRAPGAPPSTSACSYPCNRFGFNNGQTSLDGLWAGGNAAQSDMATITYQLKLLVGPAAQLQLLAGRRAWWSQGAASAAGARASTLRLADAAAHDWRHLLLGRLPAGLQRRAPAIPVQGPEGASHAQEVAVRPSHRVLPQVRCSRTCLVLPCRHPQASTTPTRSRQHLAVTVQRRGSMFHQEDDVTATTCC
jgi:hypothetical protein